MVEGGTDTALTDTPEGPEGEGDPRARRSDQRRSSRRRREKRERAARREAERRRREERAAAIAAAETSDLEIDLEAEPSPMPSGASDLSRSDRRVLAGRRRRARTFSKAGRGLAVLTLIIGAAGVGGGLRLLTRDSQDVGPAADQAVVLPAGVDRQPTLLLLTSDGDGVPEPAQGAIILAHDRVTGTSTILLLPVSTAIDIPGHGVLPMSRALEFGGPALGAATVDNLLGVSVDGVAAISYRNWATLFQRAGDLQVEVPQRLSSPTEDGGTAVQFLAGVQSFDGPRAAQYLGARAEGESELTALPRVQSLLVAWFEALAADPNLRAAAFADGLPMIDTPMPRDELVALFNALVDAVAEDQLDVRVLPVRPIGARGQDGYRPDEVRLRELVEARFAGSIPEAGREGRSLQVLNGNGLPGIGQDVAARLLPAGFRVVLTGNADTFDHEVTKIIVFDDSPEQLTIAAEIRDLLGVGEVEISLTPQSVVDVTIVVGRDFTAS